MHAVFLFSIVTGKCIRLLGSEEVEEVLESGPHPFRYLQCISTIIRGRMNTKGIFTAHSLSFVTFSKNFRLMLETLSIYVGPATSLRGTAPCLTKVELRMPNAQTKVSTTGVGPAHAPPEQGPPREFFSVNRSL